MNSKGGLLQKFEDGLHIELNIELRDLRKLRDFYYAESESLNESINEKKLNRSAQKAEEVVNLLNDEKLHNVFFNKKVDLKRSLIGDYYKFRVNLSLQEAISALNKKYNTSPRVNTISFLDTLHYLIGAHS